MITRFFARAAADMSGMHLNWRGVVIWLGAAAIVATGAWLDATYGCAFFQRSGAALVMYAILVSVASLRARAEYGDELNAIQREQCAVVELMVAAETDPQPAARQAHERGVVAKLKELDQRLAHLADAGQRFQDLRVVEGPILLIGTVLWGFGDMVFRTPGCGLY